MLKEVIFAVTLTILFSVGVGVLFVRTLVELLEVFFPGDNEEASEPLNSDRD